MNIYVGLLCLQGISGNMATEMLYLLVLSTWKNVSGQNRPEAKRKGTNKGWGHRPQMGFPGPAIQPVGWPHEEAVQLSLLSLAHRSDCLRALSRRQHMAHMKLLSC